MKPVLSLLLVVTVLAGCLGRVPPEERAKDRSWRQTSEILSRPTALD